MTSPIAFGDPSLVHCRSRPRKKGRRRLAISLTLLTALTALGLLGRHRLEQHIRGQVIPSISERLGRKVDVGAIHFGLGSADLREIQIQGPNDAEAPLIRARSAEVKIDLRSLLSGEIAVEQVDVEGLRVSIRRDALGEDNLSDLLRKLPQLAAGGSGEVEAERGDAKRGRLRLGGAELRVSDIEVSVSDALWEAQLVLSSQELVVNAKRELQMRGVVLAGQAFRQGHQATLNLKAGQLRASADGQLRFSSEEVQASSTDPRARDLLHENSIARLYLERVRGQGGDWEFNLVSEFRADDVENALGSESLAERVLISGARIQEGGVRLRVAGSRVKLARLAPVLPKGLGLGLREGLATGEWTIEATPEAVTARGKMSVEGVSLRNRRLASAPVVIRPTVLSGDLRFDRVRREFHTHAFEVESQGVPYQISVDARLPRPGAEIAPRLGLRLDMPETGCQDMLDSLPQGIAPKLEGFALQGKTRGAVTLVVDWADLEASEFDPHVDMEECRVLKAPEHMSAARLRGSFQHKVPVPGGWKSFTVGPENPDYVALERVSGNLKRSFLTTEDSAFYRHKGFITKEFRSALIKNLKRGRFAYGASSISMQVVKNVLLSREKTVARKVQELFLTWHLEQSLSKDRILEIYVNAIEFGPGLYGIKPAARQYFAKHPRSLNPVESAFLSSLLPAPTKRYKQYCSGGVRRSTSAKIERILGFMHKRRRLSEEQYLSALETPLSFRGRRRALCRQPKLTHEGHNS